MPSSPAPMAIVHTGHTACAADATSKTYKARISLPDAPSAIRLGMTAAVTVLTDATDTAAKSGIEVPLSALYQTDDTTYVWIVSDDNTVKTKKITVREFKSNSVTVDGLQSGDIVVTAGVNKLRENQKVQVKGEAK